MPSESLDLITYYNIFEYAYPVCLLTVAATLIYIGVLVLKNKKLLALPSGFSTGIFGLFLLPTFLHAVNHLTDSIANTPFNNALNWFGMIGIPLILLQCWLGSPGRTIIGYRSAEVRRSLKQVLSERSAAVEEKGRFRLCTPARTFRILPLFNTGIVFTWHFRYPGSGADKEVFTRLEQLLESSRPENAITRRAALTVIFCGLALGVLCFISWASSVFLIDPRWRPWRPL